MGMTQTRNVSSRERWISGLAGGALALWGLRRVSGLGLAATAAGAALAWRGATGWCRLYDLLGIDRVAREGTVGNLGVRIERGVLVAASADRLYRFWRNLENLPSIMSHLERVEVLDATRSRWRAKGPGGIPVEWEAEIINDQPPRLIAWRTLGAAPVAHAGSVRFTPHGASTRVDVSLQYDPPGGVLTHAGASLMDADAGARIERDLREFKRAFESGHLAA
jgi:uncharacterized membrane protein